MAATETAKETSFGPELFSFLADISHQLVGSVSLEELEKARDAGMAKQTIWSIVHHEFVHAHADHPIDVVLERSKRVWREACVDRCRYSRPERKRR